MTKPFYTIHLSGSWVVPHNWTREMPNDARYGTDKAAACDITNYDQIRIARTADGAEFCHVLPTRGQFI